MFRKINLGFTLIELLAVIVILAIIAVVVTPIVVKTIEDTKRKAFENSSYGIIKSAEQEYVRMKLTGDPPNKIVFSYKNGVFKKVIRVVK